MKCETITCNCESLDAILLLFLSLIVVVVLLREALVEEERGDLHVGNIWYQRAVVLRQVKVLDIWLDVDAVRHRRGDGRVSGRRLERRRRPQAHDVGRGGVVRHH